MLNHKVIFGWIMCLLLQFIVYIPANKYAVIALGWYKHTWVIILALELKFSVLLFLLDCPFLRNDLQKDQPCNLLIFLYRG